ncbi:MAG: hypothetical protein AAGN82_08395 [Myxococcota bacterium]
MGMPRLGQILGVATLFLGGGGCTSVYPTVFADRAPVTRADDARPIPTPAPRKLVKEVYSADVYVRRELVKAMDPRALPRAGDVNVVDLVPPSSWHHDDRTLDEYAPLGPPEPPWTIRLGAPSPSDRDDDSLVIVDRRGVPYELVYDRPRHPRRSTGSMAIASRLVHALGYRTPEVHIIRDHQGRRAAAMQWPVGVDLGPTPISERRDDDPNDRVPHGDRRTLRALHLAAAWLQLGRLPPQMLRDAYVGSPGRGHVQHFVVGLQGALGVDHFDAALAFARDPDRENRNVFFRIFTLGLSPKPPSIPPETPFPSVGLFSSDIDLDAYRVSPPFEPRDRVRPDDQYWMAKQVESMPHATIDAALAAGRLDPGVTSWLRRRLERRRAEVVAWGFDRTTPCEVVSLSQRADGPTTVVIQDLGIRDGFVPPRERTYRWRVIDREGDEVVSERVTVALGATTPIRIPARALERDYLVVEVRAQRSKLDLPRPLEIHLRVSDNKRARLAAVQH